MTWGEIAAIVAIFATVIGGYWVLIKVSFKQFEARITERLTAHENQELVWWQRTEARVAALEQSDRNLERELLTMKGELPIAYVRREDYVRNQTVIEAKLDGLALRLENWKLKESGR